MLDWLLSPIDVSRVHEIATPVAWHGRAMVLAWGVLLPLGILIARFYKVTPKQNWPEELDNRFWWRSHLILQISGITLMSVGVMLVWTAQSAFTTHGILGWSVVAFASLQFLSGWVRGSKGGPTDPKPDGSIRGDHYDMTPRRLLFERVHKALGYVLIGLASINISTGLWMANAPIWMWLTISMWWAILVTVSVRLERRGPRPSTYQAIWGPSSDHPGNQTRAEATRR